MNKKNMTNKLNKIIRFSFIIISVFFFLSNSAYCKEDKEQEQEKEQPRLTREAQLAMVDAQKFYLEDDFTSARTPLLEYLATNPEVVSEQVYLLLGFCWYSDGNIKEALKVFKKGYRDYPENFDLLSYYAASLYESENYTEAGPMMEKVYEKSEKKQLKYLEAASGAYYQIAKHDDTIRVLRRLIGLVEEPKENWFNMIFQIYYEQERLDDAEKALFEALDYFPMNTQYWNNLSLIRQAKEDYAGMVGAYEVRANIKPPENKNQWKQLIGIYRSMNLSLKEAKYIKESLKNDSVEEEDHIRVAEAYAKAIKTDEAVSYLDGIIEKKPSAKLMLKKAEILYSARKNKDTIVACDELIAVNSDEGDGEVYYMKGNAAWDLEDWDTMESAFKRAQSFKKYRAYARNALEYIASLDEAKKLK